MRERRPARRADGIARAEEGPDHGLVSMARLDARGSTNETSPRAMEDEESGLTRMAQFVNYRRAQAWTRSSGPTTGQLERHAGITAKGYQVSHGGCHGDERERV